mmetsp:Transcript_27741/g.77737  ORF Transcript_27741/g.77737 Transcript_27741/m.77737 type:complete len:232 (-) Transcript_27741:2101-2796(-)
MGLCSIAAIGRTFSSQSWSMTQSSSEVARQDWRWGHACSCWEMSTTRCWKPRIDQVLHGTSDTPVSACMIPCGTITCRTYHSRRRGQYSVPVTRLRAGWSCMPKRWTSTSKLGPRSSLCAMLRRTMPVAAMHGKSTSRFGMKTATSSTSLRSETFAELCERAMSSLQLAILRSQRCPSSSVPTRFVERYCILPNTAVVETTKGSRLSWLVPTIRRWIFARTCGNKAPNRSR